MQVGISDNISTTSKNRIFILIGENTNNLSEKRLISAYNTLKNEECEIKKSNNSLTLGYKNLEIDIIRDCKTACEKIGNRKYDFHVFNISGDKHCFIKNTYKYWQSKYNKATSILIEDHHSKDSYLKESPSINKWIYDNNTKSILFDYREIDYDSLCQLSILGCYEIALDFELIETCNKSKSELKYITSNIRKTIPFFHITENKTKSLPRVTIIKNRGKKLIYNFENSNWTKLKTKTLKGCNQHDRLIDLVSNVLKQTGYHNFNKIYSEDKDTRSNIIKKKILEDNTVLKSIKPSERGEDNNMANTTIHVHGDMNNSKITTGNNSNIKDNKHITVDKRSYLEAVENVRKSSTEINEVERSNLNTLQTQIEENDTNGSLYQKLRKRLGTAADLTTISTAIISLIAAVS